MTKTKKKTPPGVSRDLEKARAIRVSEVWEGIVDQLKHHGLISKSYVKLSISQRETLRDLLKTIRKGIKNSIKEG